MFSISQDILIKEKNLREDPPWGSVVVILKPHVQTTTISIVSSAKIYKNNWAE